MVGVLLPAGTEDFSLLHIVQTGSEDHSASYLMGTGALPGVKWEERDVYL
jgi:hypothetical protein